jgi:hypothetical protein
LATFGLLPSKPAAAAVDPVTTVAVAQTAIGLLSKSSKGPDMGQVMSEASYLLQVQATE